MARVPVDGDAFDRSEYERADQQFRLVEERLPVAAVQALAKEVVRRLAFRMPKYVREGQFPTDADIDRLCAALLSRDEQAADRIILAARRDGVQVEQIYLGYVTGAARKLGVMWEEDRASFAEVTVASGRLYRVIRGLRHVVGAHLKEGRDYRPALFALAPGETHTLGIEMVTDLFRREGWDVDMAIDSTHDLLIEQIESRAYQAIVVVAHSERMIEPMTRLFLALRIVQPMAYLVVAGNILSHHPEIPELLGADAVMPDVKTAVATLRSILDESD